MAGLPNSSNALQQWHHLFERRAASVRRQASSICSSCCAWGCRRVSMRTGNTPRWMRY
jgi:hypothetical protein